jgi:hypothetical protein
MKNVMMGLMVALATQVAWSQAAPLNVAIELRTGDKVKCFDDVTSLTYQIKIVDAGDEEAEIVVKNASGRVIESIKSKHVGFDQHSEGASFILVNYTSEYFVGLEIGRSLYNPKVFSGVAYDNGDSRGLDCFKK